MGLFDPQRRYRKPKEICRYSEAWERITDVDDVRAFIASSKRDIEERISRLGFRLKMATVRDMEGILDLHERCFPPGAATLENPYVLHRILNYGYAPAIEGTNGRILGCNICVGYDDPDRTAYGVRITVDPAVAGHNLGAELVNYSCLIGMERGAGIRRGLLAPTNYGSASNFLNYVGYVCESFHPELPGFGPRFVVALPLSPGGVMNNRIDLEKARDFVLSHEENRDFLLLDAEDLEGIVRTYRGPDFRIAAFFKKGPFADTNRFLALRADVLGFPPAG
jgi:hypothetical protein